MGSGWASVVRAWQPGATNTRFLDADVSLLSLLCDGGTTFRSIEVLHHIAVQCDSEYSDEVGDTL